MSDNPTPREAAESGLTSRDLLAVAGNLPSDIEREFRDNDLWPYGEMPITFGKHIGKMLNEIPLKYLDDTLSTMGDSWLPRIVRSFVWAAMHTAIHEGVITELKVPNLTWDQLRAQIAKDSPDCPFL